MNAIIFFTRIPSPISSAYNEKRMSRCMIYLPMVGWLVGGFGALVFWEAQHFLPRTIALMLSMLSTIILTGAFHEDGMADFCDGFGGGWTKERVLEIMKDSRLGTYGAVGLWATLFIKWLSLNELNIQKIYFTIIAGHVLSRLFATTFMLTHDYVREASTSKSAPLCFQISKPQFLFMAITGLFPLLFFQDKKIFLCLLPLALIHLFLGSLWKKKIGGFTGDCLGAAQQISEVVFYLYVIGYLWTST